jgi:hypothetical protein
MDIERQNFMKEVEAEVKKQKASPSKEVTDKKIDELFCECAKRYGTTLKKLADN